MSDFLNLNLFTKKEKIGKGSFGKVIKVCENSTGQIFAAKISLTELTEDQLQLMTNIKREVNIISQLKHPSILKFIGYSPTNFANEPFPAIVTEYAPNGSLDEIINLERMSYAPPLWNDTKKLINIYGIASAMAYLHSHGIIHRDLKPANILEDEFLFPKIADFGLSKMSHQSAESMTAQSIVGFKGTPIYVPPEGWETNQYTKAGDVYAFSIIIYELLTLEEPFKDCTMVMIFNKIAIKKERLEFKYPIADCYKELITRCWAQNPDERPTFDEIVKELKTNKDFITDSVDQDDFYDYIDLIDSQGSSFDPNKKFQQITLSQKPVKIIEDEEVKPIRIKEVELCQNKNNYNNNENIIINEDDDYLNRYEELSRIKGFPNFSKEAQQLFINSLNDQKKLNIPAKKTSVFYSEGLLESHDFVEVLKYFDKISIELDSQLENFNSIFSIFSSIINDEMISIDINIIVSDIEMITNFLKQNPNIQVSITLSISLTSIKPNAFNECTSLKKVILPYSITTIGEGSFNECSSLKQILIPSSVTKIEKEAFKGCTSLVQISIPSSVTSIEDATFSGCSSLKKVVLPSSISKIGESVFYGCSSLTQITIPSSITSIEYGTFRDCRSLEQITIPSSVTSIGKYSFYYCASLKEIIIPSSVTSIGDDAFSHCFSLKKITIPSSVISIGSSAFEYCEKLKEVKLPSSVTSIKGGTFSKCSSLKHITIPPSVTEIGNYAFRGCSSLKEIKIPPNVTTIGAKAFRKCSSLKEIEIPPSVTDIGYGAFELSGMSIRSIKKKIIIVLFIIAILKMIYDYS